MEPRNARIVIADLVVKVLPGVEVQMLILGRAPGSLAHVHVVEGLAVHVEEVGVALAGGDPRYLVEVREAGLSGEDLQGLDLGEVVEIAGCDDVGLGVLLEDLGDEALW